MRTGRLQGAAQKLDLWTLDDHRAVLRALLAMARDGKGGYSYLSFARDLGLCETHRIRSVLFSGGCLSRDEGEMIVAALGWEGDHAIYWRALVAAAIGDALEKRSCIRVLEQVRARNREGSLDRAQLEYFSEWHHAVLRELVGLPDFEADPAWVNSRIYRRLLPRQIEASLRLLARIGYIRFDEESGRYVQCDDVVATSPEVRGIGLIRYHQQMLEMAKDSIAQVPSHERSLNAVTLRLSPEAIAMAKGEISAFVQRLLALEEVGEGRDSIYQIDVQLFPITLKRSA